MHLPANAHVAVVDGEKFSLFRNNGTEQQPSLAAIDMPLGAEAAHNAGPGDSFRQNEEAGHAAAVAEALNAAVLDNKIDHLIVIADPSTLGEMRKLYHKSLEQKLVGEIAKTLTGHSTGDLLTAIANG
jgi:protein required for attachment to host cells